MLKKIELVAVCTTVMSIRKVRDELKQAIAEGNHFEAQEIGVRLMALYACLNVDHIIKHTVLMITDPSYKDDAPERKAA